MMPFPTAAELFEQHAKRLLNGQVLSKRVLDDKYGVALVIPCDESVPDEDVPALSRALAAVLREFADKLIANAAATEGTD